MKHQINSAFSFTLAAFVIVLAGCGGGGSSSPPPPPPPISVSIIATTGIVGAGGTVGLSAMVNNDISGKGVTWSLSPMTGTLTNMTTSSVTYNAPATPPPSDVQLTITATSVADPTQSAPVNIDFAAISVSLIASVNPVGAGGMSQITAMVNFDPANAGVDRNSWTIKCSVSGCGTLSGQTGTSVTYTAPAALPPNDVLVTITATSISSPKQTGNVGITFSAIHVSVAPNPVTLPTCVPSACTVAEDTSQQFTATVSFDPNSLGVSWTLTQGGTPCPLGCGTISPSSSLSGQAITYSAPSASPSPSTVTLTATSVRDATKFDSTTITIVNPDAALTGHYAFLFNGFDDATGKQVAVAGSFTADGLGNITSGEEDINGPSGVHALVTFTGGTYVIGLDNRGVLSFTNSLGNPVKYAFALGSVNPGIANKGRLIEFDDMTGPPGPGARGSGIMRLQDPTAFSLASIKGLYGFGLSGQDSSGGRLASAGIFSADGAGNISGGTEDTNDAGALKNSVNFTGLYSAPDANGRVTGSVTTTQTTNFSLYVVSASEALLMTTDPESTSGLESGTVLSQASTPYTNISLNAASVFYEVGVNAASPAAKSDVRAGQFVPNGTGGLMITSDENDGGVITADSTVNGFTYSVASNGRVTITGGSGTPPILYLVDNNKAFFLGADSSVGFGFLEPQSGGQFGSFSITGDYFFGVAPPAATASTTSSGIGVASHPCRFFFPRRCFNNLHVTQDESLSNGTLGPGGSSNTLFTVFANGRTTTMDTSVIYIISPSKFVRIDESTADVAPTVTIFDR
jgi:hypothetical protein